MSWESYLVFVAVTGAICLTPGPAALLVVAQGISNGWRRSYWSIAGIAVANSVYFALSATGVAALIVASSALFSAIKWCGVAYLFYLGISAVRSRSSAVTISQDPKQAVRGMRAFWQAFAVELSNPKALLYFVALLPQFIDPLNPVGVQVLVLGVSCVVLDIGAYSIYAWLGSRTQRLSVNRSFVKAGNRTSGGLLMLAAMLMATVKKAAH